MQCSTGDKGGLPNPATPPYSGYYVPDIVNNSNGYNTYVGANMWGDLNSTIVKVCGSSPANWTFTTNEADEGGAVQGYPSIQQLYSDWNGTTDGGVPVNAATVTSTFSAADPPDSRGNWEFAYDLWFWDGYSSDIMVWLDTSTSRGAASSYGGATIDNPNVVIDGVPYVLIHYGSGATPERMLVRQQNTTSGTINLTDIIKWLVGARYMPSTVEWSSIDLGWELCDTAGLTTNFTINGFSLTRSPVKP